MMIVTSLRCLFIISGKAFYHQKSGRTIESFHATLKKEEVYQTTYVTFEQARMALFQYIEGWYNRKRIHGSINYLTPEECEQLARQIT